MNGNDKSLIPVILIQSIGTGAICGYATTEHRWLGAFLITCMCVWIAWLSYLGGKRDGQNSKT